MTAARSATALDRGEDGWWSVPQDDGTALTSVENGEAEAWPQWALERSGVPDDGRAPGRPQAAGRPVHGGGR